MSADAASLPCPICSSTGVFQSVQSLRDRLIAVSTNKITCPVCQEEVNGLDKLTIHLFSHVNLVPNNKNQHNNDPKKLNQTKPLNQTVSKVQPKKQKPSTAKNKAKTISNEPVKFVKIFPKLPVLTMNPVPVNDIQRQPRNDSSVKNSDSILVQGTETGALSSVTQINTTCNVCSLQFIDANILKMHKCLIHNIDENCNVNNSTRYHCHVCPKNFKMRGSLMVHLRVAHYGFPSNVCNTKFNSEKNSELNQVTGDKPASNERNDNKHWQCDVCQKCFTTKYFLKKHKRLHTGETPYACAQCNKTFTFQQSYHKHLLYHNDEKPHVCTYCGRAFKEMSTLHNHQRIHTGEKPFSCETCGKCFRQRVSYLVHRRIHTGVMPYKCTACEKSFRYKVSQRTHKCQAQPPGTVVRQSGDLVEKLKKKHNGSDVDKIESQNQTENKSKGTEEAVPTTFTEVSEANAELAVIGAKLSLEDMESENFSLIAEAFKANQHVKNEYLGTSFETHNVTNINNSNEFDSSINELIETIPQTDKSVPSPSEILKNLCLSNDEDYIDELAFL